MCNGGRLKQCLYISTLEAYTLSYMKKFKYAYVSMQERQPNLVCCMIYCYEERRSGKFDNFKNRFIENGINTSSKQSKNNNKKVKNS